MAEAETFRKRPATTDRGKDYEDLTVARLILRLIANISIRNFKLSSNHADFGAFDDIILEIEKENYTTEKYALQLKHVAGKTMTLSALKDDSGNYSIKKYFKSYLDIRSNAEDHILVLFTNAKCNDKDGIQMEISDNDEKIRIEVVTCQTNQVLNMSTSSKCYKFQVSTNTNCAPSVLYTHFFNKFFIYPNQETVDQIRRNTLEEFQNMFFCKLSHAEKYLQFITEWSIRDGLKEKLQKEMMQDVITLTLLSSVIRPLSLGPINQKTKLLQTITSLFNVTLFNMDSLQYIVELFGDALNELTDIEQVNSLCKLYQITSKYINTVTDLNDIETTKLLWVMNKCPLIVPLSQSTFRALELCPHRRFIFLEVRKPQHLTNYSVFQKLSDLKKERHLYVNLTHTFTCTLQEKEEIYLQELLIQNDNLNDIITSNELLEMANGVCKIGGDTEILTTYYVKRVLSKNVVDLKFLETIDMDTSIMISNCSNKHLREIKSSRFDIILINEQRMQANGTSMSETSISNSFYYSRKLKLYVTENDFFERNITDSFWTDNSFKNIHQFRMIDDGNLEWICSKSGVDNLRQHLLDGYFVDETELYSLSLNNINVMHGDPGMGKSTSLKNLKNNFPSATWTVIMSSQEITTLASDIEGIENEMEQFTKFLLDRKYFHYKLIDKKVLEALIGLGQVIYLWDALDEISDDQLEIIANLICKLSQQSLMQWITCRNHLVKTVEKRFGVLSRLLIGLNPSRQILYLQNRFQSCPIKENMDDVINKITSNIARTDCSSIFAVPLQLFMLTELFLKHPEKYSNLFENTFSTSELYDRFIDEKFNVYFTNKAEISSPNHMLQHTLELDKTSRIENYEKVAVQMLFENDFLTFWSLSCKEFLDEIKRFGDSCGFISEVTDTRIIFVHSSYADYFAANYFHKHIDIIPRIEHILCQIKYTNVRFFLDLMLAKGCPAHIAVLQQNFEALKKHEDLLVSKDLGGRTPLHLACAWGVRYPILKVTKQNDCYMVDDTVDGDYTIMKESSIYKKILEYLLQRCNIHEKDMLFNLSAQSYAEKFNCLVAFVAIKRKQQLPLADSDLINCSILYYSVKFGDAAVLTKFDDVKYILTKTGGRSLLHLAVIKNNIGCVENLLLTVKYREHVNSFDSFYSTTPLMLACLYGHTEIAKLLLSHGANINTRNNKGLTPIHLVVANGHYKILEMLMEEKVTLDVLDTDKLSPLHLAVDANQEDIVEKLLIHGCCSNVLPKQKVAPLCIAAQKGCVKIVSLLTAWGADVNVALKDGRTPLHLAAYCGHEDVVRHLISLGANANAVERNSGYTPLHAASVQGQNQVVNLLLESSASTDSTDKDNITPLYLACQNGNTDIVEILLKHQACTNIYTKGGVTPLTVACRKGYYDIVDLLLLHGADNNFPTNEGWTPLYVACSCKHDKILHRLLESGANPNIADHSGLKPLHLACFNGTLQIVKMLLTYKARINCVTSFGTTPLYIAVDNAHKEIVQLLIQHGADVELSTKRTRKPLYVACSKGSEEIILMLIEAGAAINSATLAVAEANGYDNVVQLLKRQQDFRKSQGTSKSCSIC